MITGALSAAAVSSTVFILLDPITLTAGKAKPFSFVVCFKGLKILKYLLKMRSYC